MPRQVPRHAAEKMARGSLLKHAGTGFAPHAQNRDDVIYQDQLQFKSSNPRKQIA